MRFTTPAPAGFQVSSGVLRFSPATLRTSVGRLIASKGVGGYEPETLAAACALVELVKVKAFADIGSNIGIYSLVLKSVFGRGLRIDAFEPLPSLNEMIHHLTELNHLQVGIDARALSDRSGTATFYVSAKSDSSNSLNPTFRTAKQTIEVGLTTLDELYLDSSDSPGLLKIDTESTEPDVLAGGAAFVKAHRPWIICEVLSGRGEDRLTSFFDEHDYTSFHLAGKALVAADEIRGDSTYAHRDWLFAPEALPDGFQRRYGDWLRAFAGSRCIPDDTSTTSNGS